MSAHTLGTRGIESAARIDQHGLRRLDRNPSPGPIRRFRENLTVLNDDILRIDVDLASGGFISSRHGGGEGAALQRHRVGRRQFNITPRRLQRLRGDRRIRQRYIILRNQFDLACVFRPMGLAVMAEPLLMSMSAP